ncbi:MAG: DUF2142 domain-containing protein [Cellulosilyticum sp.]|nr:DUF2142 domain-containing protein [Cellulosilyticum sp.]
MYQRGIIRWLQGWVIILLLIISIIGNQIYINQVSTDEWIGADLVETFKDIEPFNNQLITTSNDAQILLETQKKNIDWIEVYIEGLEEDLEGKIYYGLEEEALNEEQTLDIVIKNGHNKIEWPQEIEANCIRIDLTDRMQVSFDLHEVGIRYDTTLNETVNTILLCILIVILLFKVVKYKIFSFLIPLVYYFVNSILYQANINISIYISILIYTIAGIIIVKRIFSGLSQIGINKKQYIIKTAIIMFTYSSILGMVYSYRMTGHASIRGFEKSSFTKSYDLEYIKNHISGATITQEGKIITETNDPNITIDGFNNNIYLVELEVELEDVNSIGTSIYYTKASEGFKAQSFKRYKVVNGTNLLALPKIDTHEKIRLDIGEAPGQKYEVKGVILNPTQTLWQKYIKYLIYPMIIGTCIILVILLLDKKPKIANTINQHLDKVVIVGLAIVLGGILYMQQIKWWWIILMLVMIGICFKQKNLCIKFITLASVFGVAMACLLPPMRAPDEEVHFARVYRLAKGHIMYAPTTSDIPLSISEYIRATELEEKHTHSSEKFSIEKFQEINKMPLNKTVMGELTDGTRTRAYLICAYIPQALGVFIGDLLNLSPYYVIQLGRLFNLAIYILLGCLALRKIPIKKELLMFVMLLPMSIQQAASLSPDALLNGASFLLLAYVLALKEKEKVISYKDIIGIILCGIAIISIKMPYILLILLLLLVPKEHFAIWRGFKSILSKAIILMGTVIVPFLFYQLGNTYLVPSHSTSAIEIASNEPSISQTIIQILTNLPEFIRIVGDTILAKGEFYIESLIGWFGWFDEPLPKIAIIITFIIVIIITALPESKDKGILKWLDRSVFFIFFIGFTGMLWVVSIHWYDVPYHEILFLDGTQGRYFIPFLMLLGLSMSRIVPKLEIENQCKDLAINIVNIYSMDFSTNYEYIIRFILDLVNPKGED